MIVVIISDGTVPTRSEREALVDAAIEAARVKHGRGSPRFRAAVRRLWP